MRLRTITLVVVILAVIGGLVWSYGTGPGISASVGAGGLPLIKADANPAKVPPEEGMEGEIIPNADSTVFAAMGTEDAKDPSMENITPPEDEPKTNTEFAGFRTGFSLPKEAPRKTESLFDETKSDESAPQAQEGENQYFSGIAPEVTAEHKQEDAPKPEKQATEPKKAEPPQTPPAEPEAEIEDVLAEAPPVQADNISAQALEAEEKILVRPTTKPVTEKKLVEEKPKPKAEPQKPKQQEDEAFNPVAMAEKAAEAAPKPKAPVADDVYPIKPVTTPPASTGTYYIQLSSAPKGSDMQGTWRQLQGRYGQVLAGLTPSFPEAEITGKGTFVRIQAGPMSRDEAGKRCAALRAINPSGGCLVIRR
ncbi:MAG: SPOR domain-containing protein [Proteobacteria bacterium]|nr:SPOR domain-containing protein [Pseudomonadota bacterium]